LDPEGGERPSIPKESADEAGRGAEEQLLQATPRALATALATEPTWLVYSVLAQLDVNRHQQVLMLLPGALRSALLAMSFMPVCVAPALRQAVNEAVVSVLPTMHRESGGQRARTGLPSRFGFPFAALPRDGNTIFVIPEESDQVRTTANGALGIFRSRDCGASWQPLTGGLPQANAYANVMRMAMTVDTCESAGVYVGTQGGQILASRDGGDRWSVLFNWLPPIYSLETAVS